MIAREKTLRQWAKEVHEVARSKGWHAVRAVSRAGGIDVHMVGTWIALAHSELSEALEDLRRAKLVTDLDMRIDESGKPEGFVVEMADVVIRVFDTCEALGLDIAEAIEVKSKFNETRSARHGGKAC